MFASIECFRKLQKKRADLAFWAENIMEAEDLCESNRERKHFYAYITNPHSYDYLRVEKQETLGDLEERGELVYEPADPRQKAEVFQNGTEVKIYVRNNEDDEKEMTTPKFVSP